MNPHAHPLGDGATRSILKLALACAVFCLFEMDAHAQIGVYGKFDYTHYSEPGTSSSFYGGGVGVFDDFLHAGPIRAGLDLRGDSLTGTNLHERDFLIGVRIAVKPPLLPIRPYVQGSVGIGGTEATGPLAPGITAHYTNKFLTGVFGGVDLTILPHVDFRALEVGYGRISSLSANQVTVSSGLVLRL